MCFRVNAASAWTLPNHVASNGRQPQTPATSTTAMYNSKIKAERPVVELGDLTGGRPGSIIETEEELQRKEEILRELKDSDNKNRQYPEWTKDYGDPDEDAIGSVYDTDDPGAIDSSTLGVYNIYDLKSKFDYEWKPDSGEPDPNDKDKSVHDYIQEPRKDQEGVEWGWDPIFGSSNPIDTRTVITPIDSFMIDDTTKDDSMLEPIFPAKDPEIAYNEEVVQFRKSLDIIDTYTDPFVGEELPVPRHVAMWHGYPEMISFPEQKYTNNRFTKEEDLTDFDALTPYRARKRAVELARAKNSEWLPEGTSEAYHERKRAPYEKHGTLVGTVQKAGFIDRVKVEEIQPVLDILKSCVELLSIENEGTVFRFYYHGLMKNKCGMAAWTETMIRDLGVECTGIVFETGFRKRDPIHDGSTDSWYGPY